MQFIFGTMTHAQKAKQYLESQHIHASIKKITDKDGCIYALRTSEENFPSARVLLSRAMIPYHVRPV